jgi:hypothetical protein
MSAPALFLMSHFHSVSDWSDSSMQTDPPHRLGPRRKENERSALDRLIPGEKEGSRGDRRILTETAICPVLGRFDASCAAS